MKWPKSVGTKAMPGICWNFEKRGALFPLGLWNLVEMSLYGKRVLEMEDYIEEREAQRWEEGPKFHPGPKQTNLEYFSSPFGLVQFEFLILPPKSSDFHSISYNCQTEENLRKSPCEFIFLLRKV